MSTTSQILNQTLELLIANSEDARFKSFGSLQKHKYQMSKSEEEIENLRMMYEGTVGNPEAAKKGHKTRKKAGKRKNKQINAQAAKTRASWYKNPENMLKFKEKLKQRTNKKSD